MKKSLKTTLVLILSALTCAMLMLGVILAGEQKVKATAPTTFVMQEGAMVKYAETSAESGMTFMVKVDKDADVQGKLFFVIAPKAYLEKWADFTKDNLFGTEAKYFFDDNVVTPDEVNGQLEIWNVQAVFDYTDGATYDYYKAAVVDFGNGTLADADYAKAVLREYVGLAYIKDGLEYTLATPAGATVKDGARSMAYVAQQALLNNDAAVADKSTFEQMYMTQSVKDTTTTVTVEYYQKGSLVTSETLSDKKIGETVTIDLNETAYANKYTTNGFEVDATENNMNVTSATVLANGKTVLKVNYLPKSYTITYNGVEGLENSNQTTFNKDSNFDLSAVEKENNTFIGWYDQTNSAYVKTIPQGTTQDITLTAVFVPTTLDTKIYTVSSHGGNTYETSYEFNYAGLTSVTANDAVITSENKTVNALTAGTSTAQLTFTGNVLTPTAEVAVTVEKPVWTAAQEIALFDATKGLGVTNGTGATYTVESLFDSADFSTITSAIATSVVTEGDSTETPLTYATDTDTISGLLATIDGKNLVQQDVTLYTDTVGYQVRVTPYTNVISTRDEMRAVFYQTGDNIVNRGGYYILAKDIQIYTDNDGYSQCGAYWGGDNVGLTGTFDGNGYKINGSGPAKKGYFGAFSGTIKNLAFTNVNENTDYSDKCLLGKPQSTAVLENIYIQYKETTFNNATLDSSIIQDTLRGCKINKVVIDLSKVTLTDYSKVNVLGTDSNSSFSWTYTVEEDTSVTYSANSTSTFTNINNNISDLYVISSSPLMYQNSSKTLNGGNVDVVQVFDANNRVNDTSRSYIPSVDETKPIKVLGFTGAQRFDTLNDFITAINENTVSLTSFADIELWRTDATYGLTWHGDLLDFKGNVLA